MDDKRSPLSVGSQNLDKYGEVGGGLKTMKNIERPLWKTPYQSDGFMYLK